MRSIFRGIFCRVDTGALVGGYGEGREGEGGGDQGGGGDHEEGGGEGELRGWAAAVNVFVMATIKFDTLLFVFQLTVKVVVAVKVKVIRIL